MGGILQLRPYAAKAIIKHLFDTDHLDIWITFRFPMDQTIKPANALWICEVNDVVKAVTVSAWQDAYTMLLTVPGIAALPFSVTIEYDGPSQLLKTTWDKQWEPWAAILSSDDIPLPYGSFKGNEINWTQVAAQNVFYTISDADIVVGLTGNTVFQNNQEIRVLRAGVYFVTYYITVEISIAGKHVLTAPEINGVEQPDGQMHHEFARANEEAGWAGSGLLTLAVDDKVSVGIATTDTGNPTLTTDHVGLVVTKTGPS